MESMIEEKMATPITATTDWVTLSAIWGGFATFITVMFKWIDAHFAARKIQQEAFIKAVVNEAMTQSMQDVRSDINTLFKYREEDRNHLDRKFETVMTQLKRN